MNNNFIKNWNENSTGQSERELMDLLGLEFSRMATSGTDAD